MSLIDDVKGAKVTENTAYFKPATKGTVILSDAQTYKGFKDPKQAKIYFKIESAEATAEGAQVPEAGSEVCLHYKLSKDFQLDHLLKAVAQIAQISTRDQEKRVKAFELGFNIGSDGTYSKPGTTSPWRGRKYNFVAEGKPRDQYASVTLTEVKYKDEKAEIEANRKKL